MDMKQIFADLRAGATCDEIERRARSFGIADRERLSEAQLAVLDGDEYRAPAQAALARLDTLTGGQMLRALRQLAEAGVVRFEVSGVRMPDLPARPDERDEFLHANERRRSGRLTA